MRARLLMTAIAGLSFATSALAVEPTKAPVQKAEQQASESPPVVVASASEARPEANVQPQVEAPAPAKPRRAARVTSCRCGGQNPSD